MVSVDVSNDSILNDEVELEKKRLKKIAKKEKKEKKKQKQQQEEKQEEKQEQSKEKQTTGKQNRNVRFSCHCSEYSVC